MAFVLERESRSGSFELGRFRSLLDCYAELTRLYREGDRGSLRIMSDVTGDLVYRSEAIPEGLAAVRVGTGCSGGKKGVEFGVSVFEASPSQHVRVKSAVESQSETNRAGGQTVSGGRF